MEETLEFPVLLGLIDERAIAFRTVVGSAPSLEEQVPTCPDWTLLDLVQHLGHGHRKWAAVVSAGPAAGPPPEFAPGGLEPAPREREALLAWWADSTELVLSTLREAGPDRACWSWWGGSQTPQTSGAVARRRVQESAVHTYDAQVTVGAPEPLPGEVALDGIGDFLFTFCATTTAWPHKPAVLDFQATEGRSWRLALSADGARATELPTDAEEGADASVRGTAGEVLLTLYDRIPIDSLQLRDDRRLFDQLRAWNPDE